MAVVEDRRTEADWRLGFRSLETEIANGVEVGVKGTLPSELEGTLYRIGPARHDVYGERYRHWFDGDGMVHALRLSGGRATYKNRFVATDKKAEEDAAGRRLHPGFGTPPAGGPRPHAPGPPEERGQHQHRLPWRQAPRPLGGRAAVAARPRHPRDDR